MPIMTKKRILMFLGGTLRVRYKLLVLVAWSILVCLALVSSGEGLASCPSSFFKRSKLPGKGWLAAATPPMEPGSLCRFCSASRFQALAEEYWRWYWPIFVAYFMSIIIITSVPTSRPLWCSCQTPRRSRWCLRSSSAGIAPSWNDAGCPEKYQLERVKNK